jgi:NAD(P)-dependent dehydrogenase (short-subunit alcohol dehydrogenase family)
MTKPGAVLHPTASGDPTGFRVGQVPPTRWTAADLPDLHGRTVIVTGATSGIGLVAATALAEAGASVTLAVRDVAKGQRAAAAMPGVTDVRPLDLTSLDSIRAFARGWTGRVDVLIDNAGVMATPEGRTAEGFELQLGTNHLGHFALTNLLIPHITGRVVVVTSALHRQGRIDLADLNWQGRRYNAWAAYRQSKLANVLFVMELQRRLDEVDSAVIALAAHPGYAATNLQRGSANPLERLSMRLGNLLVAQTAQMGALPTLYAATADIPSRSYVGPGGWRHMRGYPILDRPAPAALDEEMARRLWDLSEELTGVTCPLGA